VVPVDDQGLQDDGERQRRNGEKRAAQPQSQVAHAEADDTRHRAAEDQQHGQRHRIELVNGDGRIGAEREERGGAEIHVAAITAENVPRRGEHHVLQHDVAGEEIIVVTERDCGGEYGAADDEAGEEEEVRAHD
jgi:hypothetical protein